MVEVQQRFLAAALLALIIAPASEPPRFYPDDPLWQMPEPLDVGTPKERKLNEYFDFFLMSFEKPGEKSTLEAPIKGGAINTLGEVPDSLWYTNRHGRRRMSVKELVRGPGNTNPPAEGEWRITGVKTDGVTPGFVIKDSKGYKYQIKFDSFRNFEISTGADVMGSKFFYALGYFTPENYIVYFTPEQLVVQPGTKFTDNRGVERELRQSDIKSILSAVPPSSPNRYRAVASLYIEGKPLGPFRYFGVRRDDPNDIVPHEHRRDLRGLKVFSAWLNHTDTKSLNSFDTLVNQNGKNVILHYLLDFSAAFGADAFDPKSPRNGYVRLLDWPDSARSFFTLGLWVPAWARADYKHVRGVGRIESEVFDPEEWKSHYYNPAFANCLPDDAFWAAKQVMRFTEPEIRAIVGTAQYSDREGVDYLVRVLVERQRKIGETYFEQVLPLDQFRVQNGRLVFEDLGVVYGFVPERSYSVSWSNFNNETGATMPIPGATSFEVPRGNSGYYLARINSGDPNKSVAVFLRRNHGTDTVVGVDRTW